MNVDYKNKVISVDEAIQMVKSNDYIVTGLGAAAGDSFLNELHRVADRVEDVIISTCLPMKDYPCLMDPAYKHSFIHEGWFYTASMRKAHKNGATSFIPNNLHFAATKRLYHKRVNIYVGAASMPDKHGYISLSLSNTYEVQVMEQADITILEINPNYPRTFGDHVVHVSSIDYLIETNYEVPELPDVPSSEKDTLIGNFVASYINDGDCIQLGIGGVPNAIAKALHGKKDLGIHTEMLTTGAMELYKSGVVTGQKKQVNRGKMVCTFVMGTKELYDFVDDNPGIEIMAGRLANDPYVIARNDNMVSVNTTLEVDLTGQCASESLGTMQFSGSGGQGDTAIGAQNSRNGRSFICLYSTAMVKNPETGEREEISKIVPFLKPGAAVSLSRNDVDYVVTEYGVAHLRGTSIRERVELLIGIAHPKFRDELREKAYELGIIYKR